MKAGGKSARTSPEEKTGAAPSVAKLSIDANGGRGELRALGGGKHDEWNQGLTAQLAGSLPEARGLMTPATAEGSLGEVSTRYLALADQAARTLARLGARSSPRQRPTADHREAHHGERRSGRRRIPWSGAARHP